MKTVLVDNGIGHGFLIMLLNGIKDSDKQGIALLNFFSIFNFLHLNTYIEYEIFITIIWNLIIFVIFLKQKKYLTQLQAIFIILSTLVLNIFDFCLAKEPLQMLYFVAIYIILVSPQINNKNKFTYSIIIILFSALTYRTYYILIAFFSILIYFIHKLFLKNKIEIKPKHILYILLIITLTYFIFLNVCKIFSPENYNELIRVRTRISEATSDMRVILPGSQTNLILFCCDYLIMTIRMLFPIELIRFGPKYWFYVLYQIMISYYAIKALININKNNPVKNIALFIYLGFLLGSATFEPDFGSWVRHEAVTIPIILLFTDTFNFAKISKKAK